MYFFQNTHIPNGRFVISFLKHCILKYQKEEREKQKKEKDKKKKKREDQVRKLGEEADKKEQQGDSSSGKKKKKKSSKSKKKKSKTKSKDDNIGKESEQKEATKNENQEGVGQVVTASDQVAASDQVVEGKDKDAEDELGRQRQERRERAWQLEDEKRESERKKAGQHDTDDNNMSGECNRAAAKGDMGSGNGP